MIKKLISYIGQYKKLALLVPLVVLLDVVAELSMPLLMGRVIDVGVANKDLAYIVRIGLLMIGLSLIAMALGVLNMYLSTKASMGYGANLRAALFERVQAFSFANIDRFSTASLVTRLTNDVNNIQLTFMMSLRILVRAPLMLIVAFVLAFSINARLSLILAVAIPLLTAGVLLIMRQAAQRFSLVQKMIDALNNVLQENLIGVRVVKSFVREDYEIEKFKTANDNLMNAGIRAVSVVILSMPLMMLVMNGASLAVIWFGGRMVTGGLLGAGALISFLSYIGMILMSVMMISMVVVMAARAEASAKRAVEVLEAQVDILDNPETDTSANPPQLTRGKVEFRDAAFKYAYAGSGENVLEGLNFTIQPGEIAGIVGGTGTGKSSLVHLIARLYDVSAGAVLVDDVDVRGYNLEALRSGIGFVLQRNTLFSGTIRDNLLWGKSDASQAELEAACKIAQAHNFIMSFPLGYETDLSQGGVNLSGGQKQRICIARALLKKPKILVLDDSTSAVDSATEEKIRESFNHELPGTTVIIIAQRISSVRDCDKILVLDDGKITAIGTHRELLESSPIYQEINASQQEGVFANG